MKCPNRWCPSLAALHEFPTDLFTNKERAEGAVALHVLCVSLFSLQFTAGCVKLVIDDSDLISEENANMKLYNDDVSVKIYIF